MFVSNNARSSSAYFSFEYYKRKKLFCVYRRLSFWSADCICVHLDDEKMFFENYGKYLENPFKQIEFDYFGPNYYTKEQTIAIIEQINQDKPLEYEVITEWLQKAVSIYNGFYFMGI